MPKSTKSKVYAVKRGRKTGIFHSWDQCKVQTNGYNGAVFKSFKTLQEAEQFLGRTNTSTNISKRVNVASKQKSCDSSDENDIHTGVAVIDTTEIVCSSKTSSNDHAKKSGDKNKANVLSIQLYFDGASRGNPGIAGSGAHIITGFPNKSNEQHQSTKSIRHFCGHCTNNIAEYSGLIEGLKQVSDIINGFCTNTYSSSTAKEQVISIQIRGDSNLIINQMNGSYAVKNVGLRSKHQECERIIKSIKNKTQATSNNLHVSISFEHIYRKKNKIADKLANEAIDQKRSWITDEVEFIESFV